MAAAKGAWHHSLHRSLSEPPASLSMILDKKMGICGYHWFVDERDRPE